MQMKKPTGSPEWTDTDDAPRLTPEMLENAEVFEGDRFVRRGRGRPASGKAKEVISFRLDADVAAKLRESGPGWHSQVNEILRADLLVPNDIIERDIATVTALRDRWAKRLATHRATGRGHLRIGEAWETPEEAEKRLQTIVDHHARAIELLNGFRFSFSEETN